MLTKTTISLKIKKELKDKLNYLAKEKHTTETYLLEKALQNYFSITLGNRLTKKK